MRTLDVDKIFVRDLIFKDASNRPISANQFLLTRGDGGTYFGNLPLSTNSTLQRAFNEFRGGSNINFIASNYTNTLWFEPGAGIEFYSTIEGIQPKMWIAATAPEQLRIVGGSTLRFENLMDDLEGGRTLTFAGKDELQISISDNVVFFQTTSASTLSAIQTLQSTTNEFFQEASTLVNTVSSLQDSVDILLLSSGFSEFSTTLGYIEDTSEEVSTFVHTNFKYSTSFYFQITPPQVLISSLTVNELNAPLVSTFSTLHWSTSTGLQGTISSLNISTIMGVSDLPIVTFDMNNRRMGVNLGATQQPRATMDVNGIIYANNFVTSSDRRLKSNITPISYQSTIQTYSFTWDETGEKDIGCMADEIELVAPECVYTDQKGYKMVNYSKLVPVCLSLIRDLQKRLEKIEYDILAK